MQSTLWEMSVCFVHFVGSVTIAAACHTSTLEQTNTFAIIYSGMSQRDGKLWDLSASVWFGLSCSHSRKVEERHSLNTDLSSSHTHIQIDGTVDSCGELFSWPWDSGWLKPLETIMATLMRFIAHTMSWVMNLNKMTKLLEFYIFWAKFK